ncbi:hypothetical protein XAP412_320045 [Xanthomonas phaseoli pv. phaseoli]|uniref:Uncharacterized protein n=1 Tax=Xanthomonas campestris pv. phaseoli TaxID=317013 RepID=A0AB38DZM2_XANCH|nr:hypothetical protein XAP6984_380042 [Xanthomonas phaseoli pv. phaseoli]SON83792.1 hypothetical protein XAP412_320045 [Xanthomonas phaseoli pv. phaseoli]SON88243.1 hypothetical protein XAP7430_360045 [Xanthomonas phaseoli pv. phaseoli]SOO27408.1 hypothetical protein XAP6164_1590028 [Xanthomonas phaseoli pv. phaseoli]
MYERFSGASQRLVRGGIWHMRALCFSVHGPLRRLRSAKKTLKLATTWRALSSKARIHCHDVLCRLDLVTVWITPANGRIDRHAYGSTQRCRLIPESAPRLRACMHTYVTCLSIPHF